MALRKEFQNFAEHTSLHGASRIIRSRSTKKRLFWIFIILLAFTIFCYQLMQLLQKYFLYEKRFNVEIKKNAAEFPQVTVCEARAIDLLTLRRIFKIYSAQNDTLRAKLATSSRDDFIRTFDAFIGDLFDLMDLMEHAGEKIHIKWSPLLLLNINQTLLQRITSRLDDVFVLCYDPDICNISRFQPKLLFNDFDPLQCFTYSSATNGGGGGTGTSDERTSIHGRKKSWWSILMNGHGMKPAYKERQLLPDVVNKVFGSAFGSEEFLIYLHQPGSVFSRFSHAIELHLPPEHNAHLYVTMRTTKRLGNPYDICRSTYPFDPKPTPIYIQPWCYDICVQNEVINKCHCKSELLPGADLYPSIPYCSSLSDAIDLLHSYQRRPSVSLVKTAFSDITQRENCASDMTRWNKTLQSYCSAVCPQACEEIHYDVTINLVKWPLAETFLHDIGPLIMSKLRLKRDFERFQLYKDFFEINSTTPWMMEYFSNFNHEKLGKELSSIVVELKSMDVTATSEVADYSIYQLLSDIGGQLGLWVGMSLITVTEMLELLINLLQGLCRGWTKNRARNLEKQRIKWTRAYETQV